MVLCATRQASLADIQAASWRFSFLAEPSRLPLLVNLFLTLMVLFIAFVVQQRLSGSTLDSGRKHILY